jgi:hypothetical protein
MGTYNSPSTQSVFAALPHRPISAQYLCPKDTNGDLVSRNLMSVLAVQSDSYLYINTTSVPSSAGGEAKRVCQEMQDILQVLALFAKRVY